MLLDYHSANFKTFVCVERPSSTWARSAEEAENQIGLDRSVSRESKGRWKDILTREYILGLV